MPTTPVPPLTLDGNSPAFDSADEAANALAQTMPAQAGKEQAGALYQSDDGKYRYSTTIPGDADNFAMRVAVPKGHKFVAILHTHPGNDALGQVFSPQDLTTANGLKVPSYVRFNKDGAVRKYVPGITKTHRTGFGGLNVADGDPISLPAQDVVISRDSLVNNHDITP